MIVTLRLEHFRNLTKADVELGSGLNLIHGLNGSGKTSLLEAIYLLGNGKSFRTSRLETLVTQGQRSSNVFGTIKEPHALSGVGFQRMNGATTFKLRGQKIGKRSELAQVFPTVAITPNSHEFLEVGPQIRRKYFDWGVFHVEPSFGEAWTSYQRALKNKNALLSSGRFSALEMDSWDEVLFENGFVLESLRVNTLQRLKEHLDYFAGLLLGEFDLEFSYSKGYPHERDFREVLRASRNRDLAVGFAQYGPHKADVIVKANGIKAKDRISRGQQKLIVYIFILAQIKLIQETTNKSVTLLLDDLAAELDKSRLRELLGLLDQDFTQIFITATDPEALGIEHYSSASMFHVEHGVIHSTNWN
ncbi:MAG: DNA replication/repair protein RecF [Gammaproteobacteria bacterium]|nr:DNA replication/repair protein RecF [Gammaproteobacteria bacterium]MDH5692078.1 DNA replication/repair protein RecF [Gammaproteobacteria bacterium]